MGTWWWTMRIRQTKLPPFAVRCVSCQEPHRFSQNLESQSQPRRFYYAQLGEPLCHRGTADYTDVTFELRHTFGIWPSAFSKQFPPKVPPKQWVQRSHVPDSGKLPAIAVVSPGILSSELAPGGENPPGAFSLMPSNAMVACRLP
jgi:hypothetical protein